MNILPAVQISGQYDVLQCWVGNQDFLKTLVKIHTPAMKE